VRDRSGLVNLCFMCYNFARVYQTLGMMQAMEAGIAEQSGSRKKLSDGSSDLSEGVS